LVLLYFGVLYIYYSAGVMKYNYIYLFKLTLFYL
jgi:hypothetical protein